MSLLLNGAKTMTFAGTEMQCLEIYTGEAYTLPINFTDSTGNAANANTPNAWVLSTTAKFYTVDNVIYNALAPDVVTLGNITLSPDPQPNVADYTLIADWSNIDAGQGYLYIGSDITGNGTTPNVALANNTANSTLVIVTLEVTRESTANSSLDNINREPIGFIVRYQ